MDRNKVIIVILFTSLIAGLFFFYRVNIQPKINFKNFNNIQEAQNFLARHYPKGSSVDTLINDLKASGAICNQELTHGTQKMIRCVYNSGWFSIKPLTDYVVVIYTKPDSKIDYIKFNMGYAGP